MTSTIQGTEGVGNIQPLQVDNLLAALEDRMGSYAVGKLLGRLTTGSPDEQNIASGLQQILDGRQADANAQMPAMSAFIAEHFVSNGPNRMHDNKHRGTVFDTAGRKTELHIDLKSETLTAVSGNTGGKVTTKFADLTPGDRSKLGHTAMNQILPGDTLQTSPWLGFENVLHKADFGKPKWVKAQKGDFPKIDADFLSGFEVTSANGDTHHDVGVIKLTGQDGTTINVNGTPLASIERQTERGMVREPIDLSDKAVMKALGQKVSKTGARKFNKSVFDSVARALFGIPRSF